jgi:glycerol-3-phosphate acyltransferase PlsX
MIALDANGADRGPGAVVEGARLAGLPVTIYGPASELSGAPGPVVDAPVFVSNDEDPAMAVRSKEDASIVQAARAVREGRADALVSFGSTGGALAASLFHVRRISGVRRPAIAALLPVPGRELLLLDAGANVEVRSDELVQFAYMGAVYMETVHGVARPAVGLLSNGEEAKKGTEQVVEAHERLRESEGLNFAGNVEGTDLVDSPVDVLVTDGFTGNVALKVLEGTAKVVGGEVRKAIMSGTISKIGGLLVRRRLAVLRRTFSAEHVGGAVLLGLRGVVVVGHGSSSPETIATALQVARRAVDERMVERTAAALEDAGALRSAPAGSFAGGDE